MNQVTTHENHRLHTRSQISVKLISLALLRHSKSECSLIDGDNEDRFSGLPVGLAVLWLLSPESSRRTGSCHSEEDPHNLAAGQGIKEGLIAEKARIHRTADVRD